MISDSAERLSCTEGGTVSRNKPALIDFEVAAVLFSHVLPSHGGDAFGRHY